MNTQEMLSSPSIMDQRAGNRLWRWWPPEMKKKPHHLNRLNLLSMNIMLTSPSFVSKSKTESI